MKIVVGINLSNSKPRVWDTSSEYYLPQVEAVMVSYADFHGHPRRRKSAIELGLREYLGVNEDIKVYLDNGAFAFWRKRIHPPVKEYVEFVQESKPDWYPIPADYIPSPNLPTKKQKTLFRRTMKMNRLYSGQGYVPVIHAGDWLCTYLEAIEREEIDLSRGLSLGGLVPRLLTQKGASSREQVVDTIKRVRERLEDVELHVFGIGGLTTLHLAAVLEVDSIDSSGWRNRAARGLIFVPGSGERYAVKLGSWRGRSITDKEEQYLRECGCPACKKYGVTGLKASKATNPEVGSGAWGFQNRAAHNLWTFFLEAQEIERHLENETYEEWYKDHVKSPIWQRIIEYSVNHRGYL
jgi:hypothetical protein